MATRRSVGRITLVLALLIAAGVGGSFLHQRMPASDTPLTIATGAENGTYHKLGQKIQDLLKQRGMTVDAISTQGSLENVKRLTAPPTIAVMQYDVAVAVHRGETREAYGVDLPGCVGENITKRVEDMNGLKRIALLHQEVVHMIVRRELLGGVEDKREVTGALLGELIREHGGAAPGRLRVCLGPTYSGTQIVARAILKHHGVSLGQIDVQYSSIHDMVQGLHSGKVDVGFFVSNVPSEPLKTVLQSARSGCFRWNRALGRQ